MTYGLLFVPDALKEWAELDGSVKALFKQALRKRLQTPRVPGFELRSPLVDCYKVKLRGVGYRLVYLVRDDEADPDIVVLAVGRRDGGIYEAAAAAWERGQSL
ncbi:type II toxin-antitoxin system RelE/ParE family toxin [Caballeronia novacaledonica]|uniref:Type II toxin-antitoxin system RelE/ParE family toxin n=1 Tax=Caballeronia novacaledonica TaxID=1544861 RepID=A0AA37IFF4_9BURK|nr:type II toxin-antitoxin system RelE/ParE family toxin [Caballeronia novacaledonica]GJH27729.1 type II toxin-antitoxin system RelE/ParE family toxin [Caballeronia novacaledonica]